MNSHSSQNFYFTILPDNYNLLPRTSEQVHFLSILPLVIFFIRAFVAFRRSYDKSFSTSVGSNIVGKSIKPYLH